MDGQCVVADASTDGKRLLAMTFFGEESGLYQIILKDKKVVPLVPGVVTFGARYSPEGKSVVYPVASRGEITFYRQPIQDEKPIGKPQLALKLPFAFPAQLQRQRLRLLGRPFHYRVRPPQRPSRLLSAEPEIDCAS